MLLQARQRHDPLMAVLAGELEARRADCGPVARKSTLNRLELSIDRLTKYRRIAHEGAAIERLYVDLFLEAHARAPKQITLDIDATGPRLDPEIRCTASRKASSSTASTTATATCRYSSILWPASAGGQIAALQHRRERRSGE